MPHTSKINQGTFSTNRRLIPWKMGFAQVKRAYPIDPMGLCVARFFFLHLVQVGNFGGEITAISEGCTDHRSSHINRLAVEVFGLLSTQVWLGVSSSM